MKRFILSGVVFFILGVLATIAVFVAVNYFSLSTSFEEVKKGVGDSLNNPLSATKDKVNDSLTNGSFKIGEEGLPLKNLALGSAQKKALEAVGIDTETFIISNEMLTCAEDKLGAQRIAGFVAGEAPSVIETGKLLPCLKGR